MARPNKYATIIDKRMALIRESIEVDRRERDVINNRIESQKRLLTEMEAIKAEYETAPEHEDQ